jgi:flagellar FliL protein
MLISQRTSEELLSQDGKQKLAQDILQQASIPFGGEEEHDEEPVPSKKKKLAKKKGVHADYPVVGVLFSSFIIQ